MQARIELVALLAPAKHVNVEIKVGDWVRDSIQPGALSVLEEASRLVPPVLCVYGLDEAEVSVCPQLGGTGKTVLEVKGGHHFDRNYTPAIERLIKSTQAEANGT